MTRLSAAALAIFMLGALPAQAEVVDVSTLKCKELLAMNTEEGGSILLWLHGYYGGQANDTTIDLAAFEAIGTAIGEKCGAEPELGVMTAIQQITDEQ